MFLHHKADPTPGSESLDAARFDYSIESLGAMDEHLERMRARELLERDGAKLILRAGAYVGEVIRRNTPAPRSWHWLGYEEAAALHPLVASLGMSVGTAAVLWDGADGVTFPVAKVGKFIENGPEDSVRFYAQVIIAGAAQVVANRATQG
ncbi:MAG TPA: hypothetical protein VH475_02495 [Tepidisphaeraceae bacterium]